MIRGAFRHLKGVRPIISLGPQLLYAIISWNWRLYSRDRPILQRRSQRKIRKWMRVVWDAVVHFNRLIVKISILPPDYSNRLAISSEQGQRGWNTSPRTPANNIWFPWQQRRQHSSGLKLSTIIYPFCHNTCYIASRPGRMPLVALYGWSALSIRQHRRPNLN